MRRVLAALLALSIASAAAGCGGGPPPALPQAVLDQGTAALPKKHPEVPAEQLERCTDCHRVADNPK